MPAKPLIGRIRARDDRGFVLVMLALIMTVLFLMAGFAVDLGYWYLRATQIQRATDAAALAGSIDMPNADQAILDAKASAAKNGFVDGNGVSVIVTTSAQNAGKVQIKITDSGVSTFFTSAFMKHVTISRESNAEQLEPVPMGSPYNVLGGGNNDLGSDIPTQNFWLAVNGYCSPAEDGDLYSSRFDHNRVYPPTNPGDQPIPTSTPCTGGEQNPDYRSSGYNYIITVPPHANNDQVSLYDPEFDGWQWCMLYTSEWLPDRFSSFQNDPGFPSNSNCDPTLPNGPTDFRTQYTLYDTMGTDGTGDDVPLTQQSYGSCTRITCASIAGLWVPFYDLPNNNTNAAQKYRLNVFVPPTPSSIGVNAFGIRAAGQGNGANQYCDVRTDPTCPQVSGDGSISVDTDAVSDNNSDTFYLAEINQAYAGDMLKLSLWDPGEGFQKMRLIAPNGDVVPVIWKVTPSTSEQSGATYGSTTPVNDVDVSDDGCPSSDWASWVPACPQPSSNAYGTDKLNDRLVTVTAKIPDDYLNYLGPNGSTWWSVQYEAPPDTYDLHDRTTWSISIAGSTPAHLVPN